LRNLPEGRHRESSSTRFHYPGRSPAMAGVTARDARSSSCGRSQALKFGPTKSLANLGCAASLTCRLGTAGATPSRYSQEPAPATGWLRPAPLPQAARGGAKELKPPAGGWFLTRFLAIPEILTWTVLPEKLLRPVAHQGQRSPWACGLLAPRIRRAHVRLSGECPGRPAWPPANDGGGCGESAEPPCGI